MATGGGQRPDHGRGGSAESRAAPKFETYVSYLEEWSKPGASLPERIQKNASDRARAQEEIKRWQQLSERERRKMLREKRPVQQEATAWLKQKRLQRVAEAQQEQRELEKEKASLMQELSDGCGEARRRQVEESLISVQQEMETAKRVEEYWQESVNVYEEELQRLSRQQDEDLHFFAEEEERHLRAYHVFIKEKKTFQLSIVQLMATGGPRMGKSSLLARLRGEKPPSIQYPPSGGDPVVLSTGVVDNVIQLTTIRKTSVQPGVAFEVEGVVIWSRVSLGEEVIALLKAMGMSMGLNPALPATVSDQPPSTPDLTQTEGSEATQPPTHTPPEETFKEALKDHNWDEVRSILDNSRMLFCTDTGGQPEFQEVLPALIAGPSVFMLVFRVTDQLDKMIEVQYVQSADQKSVSYTSSFTLREMILQSLASIASTTDKDDGESIGPTVLLIATHKDKVEQAAPERIPELQRQLMELLISTEFFKKGIVEFAEENTPAFIVNNLSNNEDDHQRIKSAVERIATKRCKVDTPAPWLVLGIALRSLGLEVIPYKQCLSIGYDCGISKEQLNEALWFLHVKLGLIRYFHDVPELQDVIILQPQVINGKITELIAETFQFIKTGQHAQDVFRKNGIFSSSAIKRLAQLPNDLLPVQKMLKLLEHLHILAPIETDDGMDYFLPCVLSHADYCSPLKAPSHEGIFLGSEVTASHLILAFRGGYCPKGIFSALIAYLLSQKDSDLLWYLDKDALFRDQVHFHVGKFRHEVTIRMWLTHLEVSAGDTNIPEHRGKTKPHELCTSIRKALTKAVVAVSKTLHYTSSAALQIGFQCTHPSCTGNPQHTAVCDNDPCPETMKCTQTSSRYMALSPSEKVWFEPPSEYKSSNTTTHATTKHESSPAEERIPLAKIQTATVETADLDIGDLIDTGDYLVNLKKEQIFRLGLVLGLRAVPTLDIIKDSPTFLYDMLTSWLQGQDDVGRRGGHTWGALVKGLKHPSVAQNETADKIHREKCN